MEGESLPLSAAVDIFILLNVFAYSLGMLYQNDGPTHKEAQLGYVHPLLKEWRVMVSTWKGWILPSKFLRRDMVSGIQTPSLDVQMGCNLNSG